MLKGLDWSNVTIWHLALAVSSAFFASSASAGSFEFGSGTMQLKGGILGLEQEASGPVTTYTIKQRPTDVLGSDLFYNYHLTYYSSVSVDVLGGSTTSLEGGLIETTGGQFEVDGIDAQATLGYKLFSSGEFDYVGLGVSLGIATPTIANSEGDSASDDGSEEGSEDSSSGTTVGEGVTQVAGYLASTTEFSGYKVGPRLVASKSLGSYASVYADISYAWQTLSMTNRTLDLKADIEGYYFSYDLGVVYQPIKRKVDLGLITLNPSLYMTFGVNYSELVMNDLAIDLTGYNFNFRSTNLEASSTVLYLGVGYSF